MTEPTQGDVTPKQGASSDSKKPEEAAKTEFQIPQHLWQDIVEKAKEESKKAWEEERKKLLIDFEKEKEKIRFESQHPEFLVEANAKLWKEVNEKPEFSSLTFEQRYKLSGIEPEKKIVSVSTSVPPFSKGIPPSEGEAPEEVKTWYKNKGITDEQWKQLGKK